MIERIRPLRATQKKRKAISGRGNGEDVLVFGKLAGRVINNELSGTAHWALKSAAGLLKNGQFSNSTAHDHKRGNWSLHSCFR
jgi:hypothetical protein